MKRRSAIKLLAAGGLVAATSGTAYWLKRDLQHVALSVDLTLKRLRQLNPEALSTSGAWDITRILNHLARSIEYSMIGYPKMKSEFFQNTAGRLAFSVFQAQGKKTHDLDELIPGENLEATADTPAEALQLLIVTLERFDVFEDALQPHFAYGLLNKKQYALAHVMHINNHWEKINETSGDTTA